MRREEVAERLRALAGRGAAVGRRTMDALGALRSEAARERGRRVWATLRRRPDVVIAAVLVTGVLLMILHWS